MSDLIIKLVMSECLICLLYIIASRLPLVRFQYINRPGKILILRRVHPEDGSIDIWYNGGPSSTSWYWWPGGKLAYGVGYPGKDVLFGRIGTSGRPDYVTVDEDTGALRCYLNFCNNVIGSHGAGNISGNTALDVSHCPKAPLPSPTTTDSGAPVGIGGGGGGGGTGTGSTVYGGTTTVISGTTTVVGGSTSCETSFATRLTRDHTDMRQISQRPPLQ